MCDLNETKRKLFKTVQELCKAEEVNRQLRKWNRDKQKTINKLNNRIKELEYEKANT